MATRTNSQKKLLIIFALFFVPLAIATLWYMFLPSGFKPESTTNNGNLIQPVYTLQNFTQKTRTGDEYTAKNLETVWTLVYLMDNVCDEACSKILYNTRQVRIALGKDIDRVNRVAVASPQALQETAAAMWESHPDMVVLQAGAEAGLGQQIRENLGANQYPEHSVYLVDPLGNVMMQFGPELDPKLMMKDIKKLLRLSHIG